MGADARRRPSAAGRLSALGLFGDLNGLADPLTVRDTVAAEFALDSRRLTSDGIAKLLGSVGLDCGPDTRVADLSAIERVLLGVALALVGSPDVIVCDDTDHDLTPDEQRRLRETLREVAIRGVTVVGACVDPRAAMGADVVVTVSRGAESGERA
jgi:ABC-type multidrug transport system ATPase subunit